VSIRFSIAVAIRTTLTCGRPRTGKVDFRQNHNGRYEDRIEIIFEDEALGQQFVIVRPLQAIVGSQADHDMLRPKAPFVPRKRTARKPETEILPGILPPALKAIPYVVKLAHAHIPKNLSETLSTGSVSDVVGRVRRIFLPKVWDSATYSRHFKNLIWIEEHQME
jgi:helicase MOV-10